MNDVLKIAGQHTTNSRSFLLKLNQPLQKTNDGQKSLSCIEPAIWNQLLDTLKTKENVNTHKHRVNPKKAGGSI